MFSTNMVLAAPRPDTSPEATRYGIGRFRDHGHHGLVPGPVPPWASQRERQGA